MKSAVFTGLVAAFVSVVAALTPPVGEPQGNPISKPGLNELVEAGKPYSITWNPTSTGKVSLVLLRGPSENVKPLVTIVEGIDNSGSYMWTPSTDLEPDVTHYGLQLIQDDTGYFQYSTQFGISNKSPKPADTPEETPATPEKEEAPAPEKTPAPETPTYATPEEPVKEDKPSVVYSTYVSTVTDCNCGGSAQPTGGAPPVYGNATSPEYTAPASPASNTTAPAPPVYTGAAAQLKVGGALVAVVAGMAFALF